MTQQAAADTQEDPQRQAPRGRPWPKGVSGNPSGRILGKRYLTLYGDLARDLGGEAALSAIERALLSQAVGLMVRAERVKETDDAVRLANASARLLASLRKRVQPSVAPRETFAALAARAQAEANERRAIELAADEDESGVAAGTQEPIAQSPAGDSPNGFTDHAGEYSEDRAGHHQDDHDEGGDE